MSAKERAIKVNCIVHRVVSSNEKKTQYWNVEQQQQAHLSLEAHLWNLSKWLSVLLQMIFCLSFHWWSKLTAHQSESCNFKLKSTYFDHPIYTRHIIEWSVRAVTVEIISKQQNIELNHTLQYTHLQGRHIKVWTKAKLRYEWRVLMSYRYRAYFWVYM